jgi:hypothetical protein
MKGGRALIGDCGAERMAVLTGQVRQHRHVIPLLVHHKYDRDFADGTKLSVLADGADGLTGLVHDGSNRRPTAQLDWFHVSMRQRHIEQMTPDRRSYRGSGDTMLGTEAREEVALAGLARACDGGSTVADSTQSGGEDCYEVLRSRDA